LTTAGAEIDFICRAPRGTEVEELSRKELIKCLRNKIPYEQTNGKKVDVVKNDVKSSAPYESPKINVTVQDRRAPEPFKKPEPVVVKKVERKNLESELNDLNNTLKARLYDENYSIISEIKVRDVIKSLEERNDVKAIVFDGIVTQRLVDLANNKGVKTILGIKLGNVNKKPDGIEIKTREN